MIRRHPLTVEPPGQGAGRRACSVLSRNRAGDCRRFPLNWVLLRQPALLPAGSAGTSQTAGNLMQAIGGRTHQPKNIMPLRAPPPPWRPPPTGLLEPFSQLEQVGAAAVGQLEQIEPGLGL